MQLRQKKIIIVGTSLFLHGFVLILLLIIYTAPQHEWPFLDDMQTAIQTPETIFSTLPEEAQESYNPSGPLPQPESQTWAQLKPRAGSLGDSMEMPEIFEEDNTTQDPNTTLTDESGHYQADEDPLESSAEHDAPSFSPEQDNHADYALSDLGGASLALSKPHVKKKKKVSAQTKRAQKALAGMTRGYLQQLKHEGDNLIKTIGGDPTKMPSAEQLKYERYLAKIQWCLQNAHAINRDMYQSHEPIEATMRVYFTLNRAGKMADLKIIQSSGNTFVDHYIRTLFEQASRSFPPVPAYIKEDPYQLLYSVLVCWNVANPVYMGFMRE